MSVKVSSKIHPRGTRHHGFTTSCTVDDCVRQDEVRFGDLMRIRREVSDGRGLDERYDRLRDDDVSVDVLN